MAPRHTPRVSTRTKSSRTRARLWRVGSVGRPPTRRWPLSSPPSSSPLEVSRQVCVCVSIRIVCFDSDAPSACALFSHSMLSFYSEYICLLVSCPSSRSRLIISSHGRSSHSRTCSISANASYLTDGAAATLLMSEDKAIEFKNPPQNQNKHLFCLSLHAAPPLLPYVHN